MKKLFALLLAMIAEEQAQADRNAAVMAEWDAKLPQYPKWTCGGTKMYIDDYDTHGLYKSHKGDRPVYNGRTGSRDNERTAGV